mmetsp:Transcript_32926/g.129242  ORF Transcript_32926/g.129242 Transcript_32926/m.129242 type:complete len:269 (-) Transcript_32926:4129-4935(-)
MSIASPTLDEEEVVNGNHTDEYSIEDVKSPQAMIQKYKTYSHLAALGETTFDNEDVPESKISAEDGEPNASGERNLSKRFTAMHMMAAQVPTMDTDTRQKVATSKLLKVRIDEDFESGAEQEERGLVREAIQLREKWLFRRSVPEHVNHSPAKESSYTTFSAPPYEPFCTDLPEPSEHVCHWENGVMTIYNSSKDLMHRKPSVQVRLRDPEKGVSHGDEPCNSHLDDRGRVRAVHELEAVLTGLGSTHADNQRANSPVVLPHEIVATP